MAIEVFGAGAVQTAYVSYLALDITPNSLTLLWPTTYVNAPYTDPSTGISYDILAASMDVTTPIFNGNTITLPNATQSSVGQNFIITNVGLSGFNLLTSDDALLQIVVPGISYWIQLTDNSTVEGTWTVIVFGAGTSEANAALLAGNGLTAIGTKLNTDIPVISTNIVPILDETFRAKIIIWTGGMANIPLPAIGDVPAGFYLSFNNQGSAPIIIAPGEPLTTIDNNSDISVSVGQSLSIISNGFNWWTLGFGQNQFSVISSLTLDVSASVDVILTSVQASNLIQNYTGALTANITVFFPANVNYWYINNATTGAFTLSVQLAGPTGASYIIAQGTKQTFYSSGTSLFPIPTSLQLADGTAESPSVAFLDNNTTGMWRNAGTEGIQLSINGQLSASIDNSGAGIGSVAAISGNGTALQIISSDAASSINYNNVASIVFPLANPGAVVLPTGPILVPDGTTIAPSYAFSSDTTIGMYANPGTPEIIFSMGGIQAGRFTTAGTSSIVSAIAPNLRELAMISGNAAASINYNGIATILISDTGTVTLPVGPLTLTTGQILIPDGSVVAPGYAFSGDVTNRTGIFRNSGVPSVDFSIGGLLAGGFSTSGTAGSVSASAANGRLLNLVSDTVAAQITYNAVNAISISGTGVLTLSSALPIASGGTSATTRAAAINALMPAAANGGIVYFNAGNWNVLPIGANGNTLRVIAGLPTWT